MSSYGEFKSDVGYTIIGLLIWIALLAALGLTIIVIASVIFLIGLFIARVVLGDESKKTQDNIINFSLYTAAGIVIIYGLIEIYKSYILATGQF